MHKSPKSGLHLSGAQGSQHEQLQRETRSSLTGKPVDSPEQCTDLRRISDFRAVLHLGSDQDILQTVCRIVVHQS